MQGTTSETGGVEPDGWVSGIPCFFDAAPVNPSADGRVVAGLTFRVGMADEALPLRGVSHFVEHLTLSGFTKGTEAYNGFVDSVTTNFMVHGSPTEIVDFFAAVCAALAGPDRGRFPVEAQVLRAEAARRGSSVVSNAMAMRVGPSAYGSSMYREFFLERPSLEWLTYWIAQHFTAANAVFWCAGPLPAGLQLPLAAGNRMPTPEPRWLPETYPAWTPDDVQGVALSLIRPVTVAAATAVEVARTRLFDRLRVADGLSYDVGSVQEELGTELTHAIIHADCLPEHVERARDAFVTEMRRLALYGPTPDEVDRVVTTTVRGIEGADGTDVTPRARSYLLGRRFFARDDLLASIRVLDAPTIRREIDTMLPSALWLVPGDPGWRDQRYVQLSPWSTQRASGVARPIGDPLDEHDRRTLAVDESLLSVFHDGDPDRAVTVAFAECAALVCIPDGSRTLIGSDGFVLKVEPHRWPDGGALVQWIDSRVPRDRIVVLADR